MTDEHISNEKILSVGQADMAEALGGAAMIGYIPELIDKNQKAFGFGPADKIAQDKADEYDLKHPIVPTTHVEPVKPSVIDILRSDGVDEVAEADKHVEEPSLLVALDPVLKPEVTSKPDSDFVEMEIDGIMKRVPRNWQKL